MKVTSPKIRPKPCGVCSYVHTHHTYSRIAYQVNNFSKDTSRCQLIKMTDTSRLEYMMKLDFRCIGESSRNHSLGQFQAPLAPTLVTVSALGNPISQVVSIVPHSICRTTPAW